jgi:integrase
VTQFFKGIYNQRPPKVRYDSTWSVDTVLDFVLASWPDNSMLSLKDLSCKCVALLLLAQPTRVSEIAFIALESIQFQDDSVSYAYSKPLKNQHAGAPKKISLSFRKNSKLCCVTALKAYLDRVRIFRSSSAQHQQVFLALRSPHAPVSPSTISRWMTDTLRAAGVDTAIFKAHSTRSAVAADARAQGHSLKQILASAFWRSESTYRKYYWKKVFTPSSSILLCIPFWVLWVFSLLFPALNML